ncbi:DUF1128 family protein [Gracilibacillus alcaliphilus]|uniref:DUF1128 family protein n=1 Tax=Gracilibacillus alcaliphilus TaxID=1401441 RepID=UPI001957836F|nr:DUF1128 family protein [Gracilibacillus alcaliphilus]MBM7678324.1 uncharacterized protein YfkK (UPF0435 family) [Gracilibacillus alcaliphilus]
MNLEEKSKENLEYLIHEMGKMLQVVNEALMQPKDYKLENYTELKELYDLLEYKGQLTVAETHAFIDELKKYRK